MDPKMLAKYLQRVRSAPMAEERYHAAEALGRARHDAAAVVDALMAALDDPGRWTEFWEDQGVVVGSESKEVAVAAAESLARFGGEVLPRVLAAIDAGAERCAGQLPRLIRALGPDELGKLPPGTLERVKSLVESLPAEGHYQVRLRREALAGLEWTDPVTRDRDEILRARLEHPVFETRKAAQRELNRRWYERSR